ncbi:MAG: pyridoxamine 5'-phosphate oxidase family protein [Eubacteriaceae bacterium]|nr:pyridoxamine 5'-phosphate oxidase family protein [Eubacteriaceae bacterium]
MDIAMNFLNEAGFYWLVTVDSDGKPHMRPFGSRAVLDGKLYIQTNFPKEVYKQLVENGNVMLGAIKERKWMRISATATEQTDMAVKEQLAENMRRNGREAKAEDIAAFLITEASGTIFDGEEQTSVSW